MSLERKEGDDILEVEESNNRERLDCELFSEASIGPEVDSDLESKTERSAAEELGIFNCSVKEGTENGKEKTSGTKGTFKGGEVSSLLPGLKAMLKSDINEKTADLEEKDSLRSSRESLKLLTESREVVLNPSRMTFKRLTELCIDRSFLEENQKNPDAVADKLLSIKVARLDWQGFTEIDCLDALTAIEDLYMQYNLISRIENLDFLHRLTNLFLGNNNIKVVENVSHLENLELLDLSNNLIDSLDPKQLPKSLRNVDFSGNKCALFPTYKESLQKALPGLVILDEERLYAERSFPRVEEGKKILERSEEESYRSPLLDRSARSSRRPTSALDRSGAMMEAAMKQIEEMTNNTRDRLRDSLQQRRALMAERSKERMANQQAEFASRAVRTLENTRPKFDK